ncbi:casein kinase II subunit beta [Nematocida homosporus]|uniref:casein kinase II subunit beta n=1 Tax=Nematocida homosporus TaxID=1912981 RepID=UPI00221E6386|nr:casein kinase II subunit beta [Nematocida homosporus]KAI5184514.1 casein kinase II subunit beta [Nematocida homosporus]
MLSSSSEEYDSNLSNDDDWVDIFLKGFSKPILGKVDMMYIDDSFNLFGLADIIKEFDRSIQIIRGLAAQRFSETDKTLYYLIHQRYILTKAGLEVMYNLINRDIYGRCQRLRCELFPLLPTGLSDYPGKSNTKLFCFQCKELYESVGELAKIDGCAFGRTFPHLFSLIYSDFFHETIKTPPYIPRIFGFQIDSLHHE